MDSPRGADLETYLARLTRALEGHGFPFMLIGGQAVLLHGRPRLTEDVDLTLGADPGSLPTLLEVCRELDLSPLPDDVEGFVRDTFVLPAAGPEDLPRTDFIFSTTSYERQAIARAVKVELAGARVPFASAEDLILHKLFAGRPRDIEDVRGVLRRKGHALDWDYLLRWADELATVPGREGLRARVEELRQECP